MSLIFLKWEENMITHVIWKVVISTLHEKNINGIQYSLCNTLFIIDFFCNIEYLIKVMQCF